MAPDQLPAPVRSCCNESSATKTAGLSSLMTVCTESEQRPRKEEEDEEDFWYRRRQQQPSGSVSASATAKDSASNSIREGYEKQERPFKEKRRSVREAALRLYCHFSQSLLLENTASVARDHLANERTFLAWLRTSLSLITVGIAITQLYRLSPSDTTGIDHRKVGRALGATFVTFSILFLYFGNARYFHAQSAMTKGYFPASRGAVLFASAAVLGMLLAMFIVLLLEQI